MPFTLAEWAQTETNRLTKGVMLGLAQEGLIADIMSWRPIDDLSETGVRYDEVPSPEYTPLNGTIIEDTRTGKQIRWGISEMNLHVDIPEALEQAKNSIVRQSAQQTKLALRGAAYVLNNIWVNGDQASDPNAFDGINKIVGNMAAAQRVGATELDLRLSGPPTAATIQAFLDRVHQAMHNVEGHLPSYALANADMLLVMESCLRRENVRGNDYDWVAAKLEVDQPRMTARTASTRPSFVYRNIPFYDVGTLANQTTNIMLNTYTEGGSTGTGSRIFFVKAAPEDVEGIQFTPLQIRDIGLLEASNTLRKRLTWRHGIAVWGPRSISKVQGIRVA